ncbi:hypothetical protein BV22DRAFT_851316 [Leucogyrophana mollusca]|uniref:Uncharacterized protein n=1 Tax=Leucogyrophana mollusca TaxID=85980 RepID=A0ACB8B383_9AGAM|nr:hypothetical protein BV22DRAFT_851316 [Leucogyrophana mollusca]
MRTELSQIRKDGKAKIWRFWIGHLYQYAGVLVALEGSRRSGDASTATRGPPAPLPRARIIFISSRYERSRTEKQELSPLEHRLILSSCEYHCVYHRKYHEVTRNIHGHLGTPLGHPHPYGFALSDLAIYTIHETHRLRPPIYASCVQTLLVTLLHAHLRQGLPHACIVRDVLAQQTRSARRLA